MALQIIRTILNEDNRLSEFQIEGTEEFISLEEAIRLIDVGQVDGQVIRPKNAPAYIRAKADKEKNNNLRAKAVRRVCGPEIGPQLRAVLYRVARDFRNGWGKSGKAGDAQRSAAAESLINWNPLRIAEEYYKDQIKGNINHSEYYAFESWDIADLHVPNYVDGNFGDIVRTCGCAQPYPCNVTVRVYGKCHKSWAVNYVIFGWMWRICRGGDLLAKYIAMATQNYMGATGDKDFVIRMAKRYREDAWSENEMVRRISLWQQANAYKSEIWTALGYPEAYKVEHTQIKIAWAQAGFRGWANSPKKLTLATDPSVKSCWRRCRCKGPDNLFYNWNTHRGI